MFRKRFIALVAAASTLTGCAAPPPTTTAPTRPSVQVGTVSPAYPVGDLEDGTEALASIPVTDLAADEPIPFAGTDVCATVPADVIAPADGAATPVSSDAYGCVWHGSDLSLDIGADPRSMAEVVEDHLAMANGGSTDRLAHLAWLRIDGHYAVERILESDRTKGCWLTLDVSAPATMHVLVNRIERADPDTGTSVRELCPVARQVATNLLDQIDDQKPGWWEPRTHPTR